MIESLSYLGFTSPRAEEWTTFGPDVLGLEVVDERGPDGAVRLRVDDAAWRLAIHPGEADDVAYLGWGVSDRYRLAAAVETLEKGGVTVTQEPRELAEERSVVELVSFSDPFGLRQELSWGQKFRPSTFKPGRAHSGFVTGRGGMGHAVILVPTHEVAEAFYCELLGLELTDEIQAPNAPRIRFYHCNQRHHSLGMLQTPGIRGLHHIMFETNSIDDVGIALDQINKGVGGELTQEIGRHTNDHTTSFYVRSPSAFEIEYGYGGVVLDEEIHLPRYYERFSIWGHKPPGGKMGPPGIFHRLTGWGDAVGGAVVSATLTSRDVAVGDGLSLHVNEIGDTSAPPVVWLHGSGPGATALSNWERLITEFMPGFHHIAPDMIGFGDSTHPEDPPRGTVAFNQVRATATIGLLDALGLAQANIVGNSMGGMVTLRALLDAPERFDRVVLMGSGGAPMAPPPALIRMGHFYDDPTPATMRALMNNFLHDPEGFQGDLDHIAEIRTAKATRPDVRRSFLATFDPAIGPPDPYTEDEMKSIQQDVLLMHGREDKMVPLAASLWFLEHLDNARLHVVPHTGHWMQIEQPERFAEQIGSFLAEKR